VDTIAQVKIKDVEDVEFRYMDPLTLNRLLRVVKAKRGIDVMDEVVGGMLGIDGAKGTIENRARGYG
jgi:hypothetical protein